MSRVFRETFISVFGSWCSKNRPGWMKVKTVTLTKNGGGHGETNGAGGIAEESRHTKTSHV